MYSYFYIVVCGVVRTYEGLQPDDAPAHTAKKLTQDWIATNCSEFIGKDEWPPNSPDLNPLDYHVWGAMLERYKSFQPSRKTSVNSRKFCSR